MSKQDFIEYTTETNGKEQSLMMHLTANFYPPLPSFVKDIFRDSFNKYWQGEYTTDELEEALSEVYVGGLSKYGFYNYLNDDDLEEY